MTLHRFGRVLTGGNLDAVLCTIHSKLLQLTPNWVTLVLRCVTCKVSDAGTDCESCIQNVTRGTMWSSSDSTSESLLQF